MEKWKKIRGFSTYSVSDEGRIRTDKTGRILSLYENQYGVVCVGLMKNGVQYHRSVPLLVMRAFSPKHKEPFNTPINLNGDRFDNRIENLMWRPRWFAIKYNRQFKEPYPYPVTQKIEDVATGEISENSHECAKRYGLLEEDLVLSMMNNTYTWPTYQEFRIVE